MLHKQYDSKDMLILTQAEGRQQICPGKEILGHTLKKSVGEVNEIRAFQAQQVQRHGDTRESEE